jgi:hypothetical protein
MLLDCERDDEELNETCRALIMLDESEITKRKTSVGDAAPHPVFTDLYVSMFEVISRVT